MAVENANKDVNYNSGADPVLATDPTALTTAQLHREIANLKEIVYRRLESMDKAIAVAHEDLVRFPTDIDKGVGALRELHEKWFIEKFNGIEKLYTEKDLSLEKLYGQKISSIEKQFHDSDDRVEQASQDRKAAIVGELAAQEKAAAIQFQSLTASISKSEAATTKQIDQQGLLIQQNAKSFDDKINDIKDRITTIESIAVGGMNQKTTQQSSGSYTAMIIGLVISTLLGVVGIIISIMR